MKKISLLGIFLIALMLLGGCATPWQAKTTAGYVSSATLVGTAENTVQPSCAANALPANKCADLKSLYNTALKPGIMAAGNTAILSFSITDAVQQKTLMAQYQDLMKGVTDNMAEYIKIYNDMSKTPQGRLQLKYAISPELLQIIIAAIQAVVENLPAIIDSINSWFVKTADLPTLIAQIKDAQAKLPAWQ